MVTTQFMDESTAPQSLLGALLQDQQELTAVERFSQKHESAELPEQAKYYTELIPLTAPKEGEQYSFDVDLDLCTGCKACVAACHSLNGLDEDESWRNVGEIRGGQVESPYQQTITAACHHCLEPACAEGCPVKAYDKDPVTGIVKHLDDQCIGCQYCSLKCPYDVPKYNKKRGIVRKCDMCSSRLAVGEAPACVQSCPNGAIKIKVVSQEEMRLKAVAEEFLPGAPQPSYTKPTTTYRTNKAIPTNTQAADLYDVKPEHAHLPLVIMLTLTQLSVGAFCVDFFAGLFWGLELLGVNRHMHALFSLLVGLTALGASTMHLGRPLYAFRAVIGLKTSWLSREILAFGGFAKLAMAYAFSVWAQRLEDMTGITLPFGLGEMLANPSIQQGLAGIVCASGLVGIFCSGMIYVDTRRRYWAFPWTMSKFFFTALILGIHLMLTSHLAVGLVKGQAFVVGAMDSFGTPLSLLLAILGLAKLVFEAAPFLALGSEGMPPLKRAGLLMTRQVKRPTQFRFILGLLGTVLIPFALYLIGSSGGVEQFGYRFVSDMALVGLAFSLIAEGLERYLFFTLVDAPRMPRGVSGH